MANINLIPQSEKQEQVKQKAVKTSTVLAIVLFLIVGAIGGYMFYQSTTINKQIASHEDNISNLRGDIQRLEAIEISARNLGQRYSTLKELLSSRNYYSILM